MARLRRTSPDQPGWSRRRAGRGFVYLDHAGVRVADVEVERIRALVIPPAWEDVWITPYPNGHLQAVGTDAAGRRQYLYHPAWRARRDAEKFERVLDFGAALAVARTRVAEDLLLPELPLPRATASAVRLLDLGCFRIGNDVYADQHGSFGLTTLRREHVRLRSGRLVFDFVGKSGVEHHVEIDDPGLVEVIGRMRRRRGGEGALLSYREGRLWRSLSPTLVNEYVREVTGVAASAKDFRTWHATVLAAASLADAAAELDGRASAAARRRMVTRAMREVAEFLGNTPAMARSSYVDPRVVEAYEEGRTIVLPEETDPDLRQAALELATLELLRLGS
jgi:DNA topoisomerase I